MKNKPVTQPYISKETQKRIMEFFLEHTVPLILADEKKKLEKETGKQPKSN